MAGLPFWVIDYDASNLSPEAGTSPLPEEAERRKEDFLLVR
jgi:hypothetical protein